MLVDFKPAILKKKRTYMDWLKEQVRFGTPEQVDIVRAKIACCEVFLEICEDALLYADLFGKEQVSKEKHILKKGKK